MPTLHVLFSRPIPSTLKSSPPMVAHDPLVHESLISWLSNECLGGDRDAAEWTILCCIDSVCVPLKLITTSSRYLSSQSRNPPLLPISLTLSHFARSKTTEKNPLLTYALSQIFPITYLLHLSLNLLNSARFEPESENEDLHSGVLQLPSGTILLVTDCEVTEGQLLERGKH